MTLSEHLVPTPEELDTLRITRAHPQGNVFALTNIASFPITINVYDTEQSWHDEELRYTTRSHHLAKGESITFNLNREKGQHSPKFYFDVKVNLNDLGEAYPEWCAQQGEQQTALISSYEEIAYGYHSQKTKTKGTPNKHK